jgi:hypothetical protein
MLFKKESALLAQVQQAVQAGRFPPEALMEVRQKLGERALIRYAAQLSPEHVSLAQSIYQQQGWPGLQAALAQAGLMPEAIEIAGHTITEGRFEGLASAVQGGIRSEAERETIEASIERNTTPPEDASYAKRAVLDKSPAAAALRDREQQRAWAELYASKGIVPAAGRTPMEDAMSHLHHLEDEHGSLLLNTAREPFQYSTVTELEQLEALAAHLGEPVEAVRNLVSAYSDLEMHHGLTARLARRDQDRRELHPAPKSTAAEVVRERQHKSTRSALESKYEELQAKDRATSARRAAASRPTREAPAPVPESKHFRGRTSTYKALSEAADRLEHGESPRNPTPAPEPEGIRGALETAFDEIEARDSAAEAGDTESDTQEAIQ